MNLLIPATLIFVFCAVNSSAQTRISFARGKSSTIVSGILGKRGASDSIKKFVVRTNAGQHLSVVVKAASRRVYTNYERRVGRARIFITLWTGTATTNLSSKMSVRGRPNLRWSFRLNEN